MKKDKKSKRKLSKPTVKMKFEIAIILIGLFVAINAFPSSEQLPYNVSDQYKNHYFIKNKFHQSKDHSILLTWQ